jgi:hippurate hydrolase
MKQFDQQLRQFRRDLHKIPEVGLRLPETQAYVLRALDGLGLEVQTGSALSSVTAVLRGTAEAHGRAEGPRPVVLLRSDMDALPVTERTGLEFASVNGATHACGHDLHMAMLLAGAVELAQRRDELHGDVVFAFQPGEENHGGAALMLDEGVLDAAGRRVDAALGLHVLSYALPGNQLALRRGPIMSGSTLVRLTFRGRGGHGSAPHLTNDPLLAAASYVTSVAAAVSRGIDMFEPSTLTFGTIRGGETYNIIPEEVELLGTLRTFSEAATTRARSIITSVAKAVADAHEVAAEVELVTDSVPTVNDDAEVAFAHDVAASAPVDASPVWLKNPISVSEDFSWFLREVPGVFALLGAQTGDGAPEPNHSARALFDESVMSTGCRFMTEWAVQRLRSTPAGGA